MPGHIKFLDEYNRLISPTPQRVDMNYEFPEGLFTTEVNLAGSAEAYQTLLGGLEPSNNLQQFLSQVEANLSSRQTCSETSILMSLINV